MSKKTVTILVLNGVNLDILGEREPEIYGRQTLSDLEDFLEAEVHRLKGVFTDLDFKLEFFQTNSEEKFIGKVPIKGTMVDGVIMNPGAWTHTSYAIADRLRARSCPIIEVHLSNLFSREEIRKTSVTAAGCDGLIAGLGIRSYAAALYSLVLAAGDRKQI